MVNMDDLRSDGFVMLQKRLDPWWNLFWCFVAPALVAKHGWGERFLNAFMVAGALRYLCVLHFTWLVNSAAHLWGERPYDPASNPAENPLVSIAAMGEGWHNWVSSRALCQSHPCIAVPPPSPSPRVSPPPSHTRPDLPVHASCPPYDASRVRSTTNTRSTTRHPSTVCCANSTPRSW
jgi:hypothetical protein